MIANFTESKIVLSEFKTYFKCKVTMNQMNSKIETLRGPGVNMFNTILGTGRGLPIPKSIGAELSKTRMFTYDSFLMIESDPRIEKRVTEKVINLSETLTKDLLDFLEKAD